MRAVIQRVSKARVTVDNLVVGEIGPGLLVLLGVAPSDSEPQVQWLAHKLATLRIFPDEAGKMNRSVVDIQASALVVSQFTLFGDVTKGRRPSFVGAAHPDHAAPTYDRFCAALAAQGIPVARGQFAAHMAVTLVNDGPVTLILDTPQLDTRLEDPA